jgi:ubiquinone/menaquinone biosynthesis C-methylase UbiE
VPFDHNDHYHRVLLRHIPHRGGTALDVGCGTGRFARRLAARGMDVDAVDPSPDVIEEARALCARTPAEAAPRFRQADAAALELPAAHYDFISCLASIHHMPFSTLAALREALAPGGVLVVLGCYPERTPADWAWSVTAVPVNAVARVAVAAAERLRPGASADAGRKRLQAPVRPPQTPLRQVRQEAAVLLPGCRIRRLLFWRYLLVYHNDH